MAITKLLHMKQAKSGYMPKHLANGLRYIMDADKTENGKYISGHNCIPENALTQMLETKRQFGKLDKRQGYHFIISFEEEGLTEDTAFSILGEFVETYLGKDYEAVYAVHNDTDHIHGHIVFNSVRCTDGYKYDCPKGEWEYRIQPLVNKLCRKHGLSVLDLEEVKEKRKRRINGKTEKMDREKKLSIRSQRIQKDVDRAVQDAQNYEEFLEILRLMGYELSGKKHLAVKEIGAERSRRLDLLGEDYTEEMLRYRIENGSAPGKQRAKLIYLYIPFRDRHLTRYQKTCFLRKYRAGKIRRRPAAWKYKRSIQELQRLQEEYLFWAEHNIHSKNDLYAVKAAAKGRSKEMRRMKADLIKEKENHEKIFRLVKGLDQYGIGASLYHQEGYQEFSDEAGAYDKICRELADLGYSATEARKLHDEIQRKEQKINEMAKKTAKEQRIAARLLEKVYERAESQRIEREKEIGYGQQNKVPSDHKRVH